MRAHEDELNRKCFCKLQHSFCSYKIKLGRFINILGRFKWTCALVEYDTVIA